MFDVNFTCSIEKFPLLNSFQMLSDEGPLFKTSSSVYIVSSILKNPVLNDVTRHIACRQNLMKRLEDDISVGICMFAGWW